MKDIDIVQKVHIAHPYFSSCEGLYLSQHCSYVLRFGRATYSISDTFIPTKAAFEYKM